MGSKARFHKKGLAGPPMPMPRVIAFASERRLSSREHTWRPSTNDMRARRTQLGRDHACMTCRSQARERRSNALLWSARKTALPLAFSPAAPLQALSAGVAMSPRMEAHSDPRGGLVAAAVRSGLWSKC